MGRSHYSGVALTPDISGKIQVAPNAQITVFEPGTTNPIAQTLYANAVGSTTKTNPFTAGSDGYLDFWIDTQQFVDIKHDGSAQGLGQTTLSNQATHKVVQDPYMFDIGVDNLGVSALVESPASNTANAASNSAKLTSLSALIGALGGGTIFARRNTAPGGVKNYWHVDRDFNFDNGGTSGTVHLIGEGPNISRFMLKGTSGPWFKVQGSNTGINTESYFMNFSIHHTDNVAHHAGTSDADILVGPNAYSFNLTNVFWYPEFTEAHPIPSESVYTSTNGAWTCLETKTSVYINHCLISSRVDNTPTTIMVTNADQYELVIFGRTRISTAPSVPTIVSGVVTARTGGGCNIDIGTMNALDLLSITDRSLISGGNPSIRHGGSGVVFQLRIDACQLDVHNVFLRHVPTGGGGIRTASISNCWAQTDDEMFVYQGGTPTNLILNNIQTSGHMKRFVDLKDIPNIVIDNCNIAIAADAENAAGSSAVYVDSINGTVHIDNNDITVLRTDLKAAIEISTVTHTGTIHDNVIRVPDGVEKILRRGGRTEGFSIKNNRFPNDNPVVVEPDREDYGHKMLSIHPNAGLIWTPSWLGDFSSRSLDLNEHTISYFFSGATAFDVTNSTNGKQVFWDGDRCILQFDGAGGLHCNIPDHNALSFASGGMSIYTLANVKHIAAPAGDRTLCAKAVAGAFEYWFYVDTNNKLHGIVYKSDGTAFIEAVSNSVITDGALHLYHMSYDGTANLNSIVLYQDNVALASTNTMTGSYTTMSNTTAIFEIGSVLSGTTDLFNGKIASMVVDGGPSTPSQRKRHIHVVNWNYMLALGAQ